MLVEQRQRGGQQPHVAEVHVCPPQMCAESSSQLLRGCSHKTSRCLQREREEEAAGARTDRQVGPRVPQVKAEQVQDVELFPAAEGRDRWNLS